MTRQVALLALELSGQSDRARSSRRPERVSSHEAILGNLSSQDNGSPTTALRNFGE